MLKVVCKICIFISYQRTPLHIAAEGGYVNTVKYLVRQGSTVNIRDKNGVRVLLMVNYYCRFEFELASFIHRHLRKTLAIVNILKVE